MRYTKLIFIQVILIFGIINFSSQNNSLGLIPANDNITPSLLNTQNLTVIEPILVNSNAEIDLYAQNNNLTGNGTQQFPYLISSVFVNGSNSDYTVSFTNIDRYIIVKDSYMFGGLINSILANSVRNLVLFNNTVDRSAIPSRYNCCGNEGILIKGSANVTVEQNLVEDNRVGIKLAWNTFSTLAFQGNITLRNNTLHNVESGILVNNYNGNLNVYRGNLIEFNFISDASLNGIYLQSNAINNTIQGNWLLNADGLNVFSQFNTISYNLLSNSQNIWFDRNGVNNTIFNNTISSSNSLFFGDLNGAPFAENNTLKFNNFMSSNPVDYRLSVYDNYFDNNFYSIHDNADLDNDGFADSAFSIASGNIQDINPLANENLDSFGALNITFRLYPGYTESTATTTFTSSPSSSTTSSSTMVTPIETGLTTTTNTENDFPTTTTTESDLPASTSVEFVTITVTDSSTDTDDDNNTPSTSASLGSSYQIAVVISSFFTLFKLKRRIKS